MRPEPLHYLLVAASGRSLLEVEHVYAATTTRVRAFWCGLLRGLLIVFRRLRPLDMGPDDIAKGVAEGWLVPDPDEAERGWFRFVYDFMQDGRGNWVRVPSASIKRVRVLLDEESSP